MLERKTLSLSNCQIKAEGKSGKFAGYASVFNQVDNYGDTILPGAYQKTLETNGMPKMFLQHESWELPIGKWLVAKEDDHGLYVEGELTVGMVRADDTYAALKHGTLDGLSIGYRLSRDDYEYVPGADFERRVIKTVSLLAEVSPVVFPADVHARIDLGSVKSEIDQLETIRDFEYFLRDTGKFSKGLTNALISRARVLFGHRDDDRTETDAKSIQVLSERLEQLGRSIPTTLRK